MARMSTFGISPLRTSMNKLPSGAKICRRGCQPESQHVGKLGLGPHDQFVSNFFACASAFPMNSAALLSKASFAPFEEKKYTLPPT